MCVACVHATASVNGLVRRHFRLFGSSLLFHIRIFVAASINSVLGYSSTTQIFCA